MKKGKSSAPKADRIKVYARLTPETYALFEEIALSRGDTSVASIVTEACEDFSRECQTQALRKAIHESPEYKKLELRVKEMLGYE
ncbi:MAG: hypothetical protein LBL85_01790 [Methanocalculaceae archaeon]|jgi:hypothetical protein|nr:hypothetical protein [Methanocalculaceae archaeon]